MALEIDYKRGVTHRRTPGGLQVFMYKKEPGEFYFADGSVASLDDAGSAGFDVAGLKRERDKMVAIEKATQQVEQQFELATENIEEQFSEPEIDDRDYGISPLRLEKNGAWYNVLNTDGSKLNPKGLRRDEAIQFAKNLLSPQKEAEAAAQ